MDFSTLKNVGKILNQPGRNRRSGHKDAFERRQLDLILQTVLSHPLPDGRGTKAGGDAMSLDRFDQVSWIDLGRVARVHIRHNRGYPQGWVKQGKNGEAGQIYFSLGNTKFPA